MQLDRPVKIAAVSDVHVSRTGQGSLAPIVAQAADAADVLVIPGDLTDYGLPEEAKVLVKELAGVRIPVVAVLGNHDYEAGKEAEVTAILRDAGVHVLDGDAVELLGVGFAGGKGFAGGFGRGALGPWGETTIKSFVREAVDEALKLETALAKLRTRQRVAVLHYSPVRSTVEGEPLEIFPYLGSSRLEEPLTRYPVSVVFHGHAHNGTLSGRTSTGTPVYNVALPLLRKTRPNDPPFLLLEIPREEPVAEDTPRRRRSDAVAEGSLR